MQLFSFPAHGGFARLRSRWRQFRVLLRRSLRGDETELTRGPIGRAVFILSVPMILEMVMESVFAVVDIFYVSRLGSAAVAVVGLTEATITLVYAVAIGLSMAVTAMVARRIGEKNPEGARQAAAQALWLGLAVAAVIGFIGITWASDILALMGADDEVIRQGAGYTATLLGGSVTIMYLFLINAIFRGAGDAGIAMRALWLANGINLVLDPLLIFGLGPFPEMGVTGAAVATTIGRGIGVIYQLWCLFGSRGRVRLRRPDLVIVPPVMLRMVRISLGGIGQFIIATSSWIGMMRIMAQYGADAVAGYTIAIRVIIFTFLPAWGMANAAATLVGQNLGAGKPARAVASAWAVTRYNVLFLTAVAIVFIVLAPGLIGIFSSEAAVVENGVACLRWLSYGYPTFAVGMVITQSLNGAGDTRTPTMINFVTYWLIQIPLAWFLANSMQWGPTGVYVAIFFAESLMAVLAVVAFRGGRWKTTQV